MGSQQLLIHNQITKLQHAYHAHYYMFIIYVISTTCVWIISFCMHLEAYIESKLHPFFYIFWKIFIKKFCQSALLFFSEEIFALAFLARSNQLSALHYYLFGILLVCEKNVVKFVRNLLHLLERREKSNSIDLFIIELDIQKICQIHDRTSMVFDHFLIAYEMYLCSDMTKFGFLQ